MKSLEQEIDALSKVMRPLFDQLYDIQHIACDFLPETKWTFSDNPGERPGRLSVFCTDKDEQQSFDLSAEDAECIGKLLIAWARSEKQNG